MNILREGVSPNNNQTLGNLMACPTLLNQNGTRVLSQIQTLSTTTGDAHKMLWVATPTSDTIFYDPNVAVNVPILAIVPYAVASFDAHVPYLPTDSSGIVNCAYGVIFVRTAGEYIELKSSGLEYYKVGGRTLLQLATYCRLSNDTGGNFPLTVNSGPAQLHIKILDAGSYTIVADTSVIAKWNNPPLPPDIQYVSIYSVMQDIEAISVVVSGHTRDLQDLDGRVNSVEHDVQVIGANVGHTLSTFVSR